MLNFMNRAVILAVILLIVPGAVAHEEEPHLNFYQSLAHYLNVPEILLLSPLVIAGSIVAAVAYGNRLDESKKTIIFAIIVIVSILTTAFLVGQTIALSTTSWSKGLVHWHADFEIWTCGEKQTLPEPTGLWSRVGTGDLHHHGDYRMHVEGVIKEREDATLGKFFDTIDVPFGNDMLMGMMNGDMCPSGGQGTVKMYVNGDLYQGDYRDYVIAPYSNVPPGDYIKIVFE